VEVVGVAEPVVVGKRTFYTINKEAVSKKLSA
jgi:hypothetical protein